MIFRTSVEQPCIYHMSTEPNPVIICPVLPSQMEVVYAAYPGLQ